ncbi:MAG TPA: hypothetical protein VGD17_10610 [Chitinophagaceae bacterium]
MSEFDVQLPSFTRLSDSLFAEAAERAAALPANTVQVWPGGQTYPSIQQAINSITDAGPQLQYQVSVGAGTFNESVVMKDYVYITGAGQDITIITAPAQMNIGVGVVNSASNCGISEVTINAPGGSWGSTPIGIKIMSSGNFHISGVTINSSDSNIPGNNVRGISNNTGSYSGNVILGQSTINATGTNETTAVGIELFGMSGFNIFVNLSTIQVNCPSSFGVSLAAGANATLDSSKIIATTWALYNSDGSSPITANQCSISGPVSSGVVVNN